MQRRTAKFHIEVEYVDEAGELSTEGMKILKCESEGDYKGITLAMTTGLAFATEKGSDGAETFQKKLRLLRGTVSALQNCLLILRGDGALNSNLVPDTLIDKIGVNLKEAVDLISYGIGKILRVTNDEVNEFNQEYKEENLNKRNNDGESRQQGLEQDGIEDYL